MSDLTTVSILLFIPLVAGFAGLMFFQQVSKINKYLLTFSGSFLLSITVLHILPDVFSSDQPYLPLFILIGFFIQIILGSLSGGLEHGHVHPHEKIGWTVYISIMIHAIIEGMAITDTDHHHHLSEQLTLGIIIHKTPVAIALAGLLHATTTKPKAILLLIMFSLATPAGYFIGPYLATISEIETHYYLLAVAVGVFLHVSTVILFESEEGHRFDWSKIVSIVIGFGLALLTLLHVH